jgi:hypothetical protein
MKYTVAKPIIDNRQFLKVDGKPLFRLVKQNGRHFVEVQQIRGRAKDSEKYAYITPEALIELLKEYTQLLVT